MFCQMCGKQRPKVKSGHASHRKCGIAPARSKQKATRKLNQRQFLRPYDDAYDEKAQSTTMPSFEVLGMPSFEVLGDYDDEVLAASTHTSFEVEGLQTPASVYCPLSPTIMSVHLPGSPGASAHLQGSPLASVHLPGSPSAGVRLAGSPIPKALDLDDTACSLVLLGKPQKSEKSSARPCKVRFECRGDPEAEKYVPQLPARRPFGTGKFVSRPLGCTLVANFGGA